MNTEQELLMELVIEFAKKVLQYPKGSQGYDPVDASNLAYYIKKYDELLIVK